MRQQYLLLNDVEDVGRKGTVISAKAGFARNYLLPQQKAVLATPHTLRKQEQLQKERAAQALVDKKASEELREKLEGTALHVFVKVDSEGHLYGSVSAADIARLFEKEGYKIDRKNILLPHPIKVLGVYDLTLRLNEEVYCNYSLSVESDKP